MFDLMRTVAAATVVGVWHDHAEGPGSKAQHPCDSGSEEGTKAPGKKSQVYEVSHMQIWNLNP